LQAQIGIILQKNAALLLLCTDDKASKNEPVAGKVIARY
jgi:hypothetical protein